MLCKLKGGPFDGQALDLQTPQEGTLMFHSKGQSGKYINFDGQFLYWIDREQWEKEEQARWELLLAQPDTTTSAQDTELLDTKASAAISTATTTESTSPSKA